MKLRKKTAMVVSFAVGSLMFATTAFAEVASKSGYEQLKDAFKYTSESFSTKLSSYTIDISFVMKDNDTIVSSNSQLQKYDVTKGAKENTSTSIDGTNIKTENYNYSDKNSNITHNSAQDTYYVYEFTSPQEAQLFTDPFKSNQAADLEKIADALIGNLKDYVVVSPNPDGSKELSGSLSKAQIPVLINALVSLQFKNSYNMPYGATTRLVAAPNSNDKLGVINEAIPTITKDVFVKEVKGKLIMNKDGLIESILGTGVLSGIDKYDKVHKLSFEILVKLTNINSTIVNKPDLSGKTVEKTIQDNMKDGTISNPEKFIGKYKNDIIIEKNGKFEKIGERFIDITHIDDKNIAGRYHEEYKVGYDEYSASKKDFTFDAANEKGPLNATFDYTNASGKTSKGTINIDPSSAQINVWLDEPSTKQSNQNGQYARVFE